MTMAEKNIGLWLEWHGSRLTEASTELLMVAGRLAQAQQRLVGFTAGVEKLPEAVLAGLPLAKLYYTKDNAMATVCAQGIVNTQESWKIFLAPMSLTGREVAANLSLLYNSQLVCGVSGLARQPDGLQVTQLTAGGLAQQQKTFPLTEGESLVLGLTPGDWNELPPPQGRTELIELRVPGDERVAITKEYLADWQEIGVNEADVVVAGGNGLQNQANFALLHQLGEALAAPVGGSRVAEDKGWIDHQAMIGATGKTIAPELYIACGISGAIQHLIGIQNCKRVVAVNTDPMCAMMAGADLAVQGDAAAIAQELAAQLTAYQLKKEG